MNIAQFQQEYARRSALTTFERINEDAARSKAAKADAFQQAGGWWCEREKWDYATTDVLARPTEVLAFHALLWPSGRTAAWMMFLRVGWRDAQAVVLSRQAERDAERRERVRRLRLRRPVGVMAMAI